MNATIQCLKTVPELCEALKEFKGGINILVAVLYLPTLKSNTFLRGQLEWWDVSWLCDSSTERLVCSYG